MKYDGSLSRGGEVTPLQHILLARRSYRKYGEGEATREQLEYVTSCVERLIQVARLDAARIEIIGPGDERDAVVRAATKGLIGKVNPWLPFTKAPHLVLCGALYPEPEGREAGFAGRASDGPPDPKDEPGLHRKARGVRGGAGGIGEAQAGSAGRASDGPPDPIETAVKQASMAMQAALLAAAEVGLASCWMAGINHERIERVRSMVDGAKIVAISPLGLPPRRRGLSFDVLAFHLVSKRRKPLVEIWKRESWSRGAS